MDKQLIKNLLSKIPFEYEAVYDVPEIVMREMCRKKFFCFSIDDFDGKDYVFKLFITKGEGKNKVILYYLSQSETQCLAWFNFDSAVHSRTYFWKRIIKIVCDQEEDPKKRNELWEDWKKSFSVPHH